MSAPEGLIAERYRLKRLVGTGGMGVVWEAWDERLHRAVALKQLHPQPGLSDAEAEVVTGRALREARITARLQHPHAVSVFDVVEDDGQPCLVMQLVPSQPLSATLQGGAVLPVPEVARIGWQVASALDAAHRVGIVHRDVKPGNILLAEDGTARISDFGIAHALGDVSLTSTGMLTGTPAYLAPEVARGEDSGFPADVFSLGATLYTALEGRPPFGTDPNPMALLHRVASGVSTPPEHSGALTPLLTQMLEPRAEDRPSMRVVAAALAPVADGSVHPTVGMPVVIPPTQPVAPVEEPGEELDEGPVEEQDELLAPDDPVVPAEPVKPAPPGVTERRRPGWALAVALLALVLVAAWLVFARSGGAPPDQVAAPSVTASPSAAPTSASASAPAAPAAPASTAPATSPSQPTPSPSTATSAATTAATSAATTAATNAPSTAANSAAVAPAGSPTPAELSKAVSGYYGLMPGGTDQAWPLMTARYQAGTAGGRQSYQRFWDQFSKVTATAVTATSPGSVQATITYTFKDGRVQRERTVFGLVNDGGVLKIDSSTVTASS